MPDPYSQFQSPMADPYAAFQGPPETKKEASPLSKFGTAVYESTLKPLVHPLDTLESFGKSLLNPNPWRNPILNPAGSQVAGYLDPIINDISNGGYAEAAGHAIGPPLMMGLGAGLTKLPYGRIATGAKGAVKGGIEAIPKAKTGVPAAVGSVIGSQIAGPHGAEIGGALGAAPGVIEGMYKGAKSELNPPPPPKPTAPPPGFQGSSAARMTPPPVPQPRTAPIPPLTPNPFSQPISPVETPRGVAPPALQPNPFSQPSPVEPIAPVRITKPPGIQTSPAMMDLSKRTPPSPAAPKEMNPTPIWSIVKGKGGNIVSGVGEGTQPSSSVIPPVESIPASQTPSGRTPGKYDPNSVVPKLTQPPQPRPKVAPPALQTSPAMQPPKATPPSGTPEEIQPVGAEAKSAQWTKNYNQLQNTIADSAKANPGTDPQTFLRQFVKKGKYSSESVEGLDEEELAELTEIMKNMASLSAKKPK